MPYTIFHELWHVALARHIGHDYPANNTCFIEGIAELSSSIAFSASLGRPDLSDAYPVYTLLTAALGEDLPRRALEDSSFYYDLTVSGGPTARLFDDGPLNELIWNFTEEWGLTSIDNMSDLHDIYTIDYADDIPIVGGASDEIMKWIFFKDLLKRNRIDFNEFLVTVAPNDAILGVLQA